MLCFRIRFFPCVKNPHRNLMQCVRNVSQSTNFLQPICSRILQESNINYYGHRLRHCGRLNSCEVYKLKKAAKEAADKKPKSFWESIMATIFPKKVVKPKPPKHHCRVLQQRLQWEEEPIPEFIKEMCKDLPPGGQIYKTRGHAFILEVPCAKKKCKKKTRTEKQLSRIERSKQSLDLEDEKDPMPNFSNCGKRLLDLQTRKLHPLYQKLEQPITNHPKPWKLEAKYRCDTKEMSEYKEKLNPLDLYYNRKKLSFADFKMSALPRYLELREQAYKTNTYSSLEFRKERMPVGKEGFREKALAECKDDCPRWINQKPRH